MPCSGKKFDFFKDSAQNVFLFTTVHSTPIAYICNATKRAQLLWDSVRCLPRPCASDTHCIATSAEAEAAGTSVGRSHCAPFHRRRAANQDLDLSAVPRMLPTLGLKEGRERVGLAVRSATRRRPAIWKASLNLDVTDPERLGQSRIDLGKPTREVLLSYLVRFLLQPSTPSDTEEDDEGEEQPAPRAHSYVYMWCLDECIVSTCGVLTLSKLLLSFFFTMRGADLLFLCPRPIDLKDPESEKALNLILDLIRLSQNYMYADHRKQKVRARGLDCLDNHKTFQRALL